ncbi:putative baseplate assembly protein [Sphingomonas quercus]|uniref:Baseplate assembly protein n=1 Tax=Sphingomonas quercus TaxID=2842451 RepID=A0ABS6BL15_9SPHN|nr:putative baseplate assembly protein [Sphingomonas quercus]MBU3078991.1 putative baseplate assembly protein [Sphingomonas quercus]
MTLSADGAIWCGDDRRSGVLANPAHPLNGVDFVEYRRAPLAPPGERNLLDVTFLKPPPALAADDFAVLGGVRIIDIRVLGVAPVVDPRTLTLFLNKEGDFSTYILSVVHPLIDEERSEARFSFKAGCPTEFDCRLSVECPPEALIEPALDYLAKDYQSFRRLLLDLIAARNPGWQERLPADLGMTIVELIAYAGDYLSYLQDAGPGTEGYLDTCLHRVSAARHARLVDYRMHQGRNAFTFVHLATEAVGGAPIPLGTRLLTRIGRPLIGETAAPGATISIQPQFDSDPALADVTVFETTTAVTIRAAHNELRIHSGGDAECCLAAGTCQAFLYRLANADGTGAAVRPQFRPGDWLLFEEVLDPRNGSPYDADPAHRQVVRITAVADAVDEAFTDALTGGALTARLNPADPPLPLQRVEWRVEDALASAFCLSAVLDDETIVGPVTIARGNIVPADHGRSLVEVHDVGPDPGAGRWPLPSLALAAGPLTWQAPASALEFDATGTPLLGRTELDIPASAAAPAIVLMMSFPGQPDEIWTPQPSLLESDVYDQHFVAEIDNDGAATLRFGDDHYGRRPLDAARVVARYRIGNGAAGNIGRESLVHLVTPDPPPPGFQPVTRLFQPLPGRGGEDAETIEHVRQIAPEQFRAIQFRAVTEADWEEVALRHPDVAAARATFRWTGSWHTIFVAIHPHDEAKLRRLPGGGAELAPDFAAMMRAHLMRFKLAGYDLAVRAAVYVPLEIEVMICVAPGYFRGDVLAAVAARLSNRAGGLFDLDDYRFGEPVYLSRLYAAIEAIDGVDSATARMFKRYWDAPRDELARGVIEMAPFEIARLDNDASLPENGVLRLIAVGGL